jgi:hypothetical protein
LGREWHPEVVFVRSDREIIRQNPHFDPDGSILQRNVIGQNLHIPEPRGHMTGQYLSNSSFFPGCTVQSGP